MKSFIVFALFVAAAVAAPATLTADGTAEILKYDSNNIGVDGYNYSVLTSNGIKQDENAILKNPGTDNEAIEVQGQFSYTGPDGVIYAVTYIANEFGFQPQGAHIPKAA